MAYEDHLLACGYRRMTPAEVAAAEPDLRGRLADDGVYREEGGAGRRILQAWASGDGAKWKLELEGVAAWFQCGEWPALAFDHGGQLESFGNSEGFGG